MNNSAVRSSVRMVRLADLEPLHVAPASQAAPSPSSGAPASQAWPPPIGSDAAEDLMSEMRAAYVGAMASTPKAAAVPPVEVPRLPRGKVVKLPVVLNARAADYARIWIVNLVLTLLTLGLYLPWARVRSQRYFLRRTVVAGHGLDYHAPPASHLPRYGLVLALAAGVVGACLGSPLAGLLAFSMALAVAPLAVHTSLTQRMAHTSWAGRRLSFKGQFTAVYSALLMPLMGVLVAAWLTLAGATFHHPLWWVALGFVAALWLLGVPLFLWAYFHYRQGRLEMGPLRLWWQASPVAMVVLWARTAAWSVLVCGLVLGLSAVLLAALLWWQGPAHGAWWLGIMALSLAAVLAAVTPYVQARLQNLVWSKTGNRSLRFRSRLSVQGYVLLQVRHALLLVLTLGLYWPWAVVASRRMRTEALTVWARVDTEVLKAHWVPFAEARVGTAPKRRASA
ncbi:DUF898 domain-containing protein [Aquabacterium sp. CECT 9606]|uniref:DUF898 domain-containing protein n=1 Tax=Aquabacterium sp. CECT 9606 TaxID=2845822 RepID=UPI001E46BA3D|nr:DUF898 domain-containing protein [Aquabacterium sp. CECT 9606]